MNQGRLLTPEEAEAVIDERIEQFGLGAMPRVKVTVVADGEWLISWEQMQRIVRPMNMPDWHAWLEENVGSLDAGDLETTES